MAKIRLSIDGGAERKLIAYAGTLTNNGENVREWRSLSLATIGATGKKNTVTITTIGEASTGKSKFVLSIGKKSFEQTVNVTSSTKKVIVKIRKNGLIGTLLGKPFKFKLKLK